MIHELKEYPEFFEDVTSGKKTFEVRKADRDFKVGDLLALNEYDPDTKKYTNRCCVVYIDCILNDLKYCKEGYVVLGIKRCVVLKNEAPIIGGIKNDNKKFAEQLIYEIVNRPPLKAPVGIFYMNGRVDRQNEIIDIINEMAGVYSENQEETETTE